LLDQQPGQVVTALTELDELPLARASVRQEFLRRSRRWRDQLGQETSRLRDQFQDVGDRFEERLEGWLEEPDGLNPPRRSPSLDGPEAWEAWGEEPEPPPSASRYAPQAIAVHRPGPIPAKGLPGAGMATPMPMKIPGSRSLWSPAWFPVSRTATPGLPFWDPGHQG
jgi:hypothetical protein